MSDTTVILALLALSEGVYILWLLRHLRDLEALLDRAMCIVDKLELELRASRTLAPFQVL